MSKNTKIQWCDDTINPTLGCDGCELCLHRKRPKDEAESQRVARDTGQPEADDEDVCYANAMTERFGEYNPGLATKFWEVSEAPGRMADAARWSDLRGVPRRMKPWLDGLPRIIFVSDMADALSRDITFEYLKREIIENIANDNGSRHHWLWLTKRPARMAKFSAWLAKQGIAWPSNLWPGTSVTTRKTTSRVEQLLSVGNENTIHFVSVEPQWEAIDLRPWLDRIGWVIQGGQSGHKSPKHFHVEWVQDMIAQCREHQVPLFVKQFGTYVYHRGERIKLNDGHGGDWSEWPKSVRVREMPIYVSRKRRRCRQLRVA